MSFNSKEEEEAYNDYILRDGIHEKIRAKIDKKFRVRVLEKVYERTRRRIREKGSMIKHDDAMRAVIAEQGREIMEEIYNEALDGIAKSYPLHAELMRLDKPEKTRQEAMRAYFSIMEKFE